MIKAIDKYLSVINKIGNKINIYYCNNYVIDDKK